MRFHIQILYDGKALTVTLQFGFPSLTEFEIYSHYKRFDLLLLPPFSYRQHRPCLFLRLPLPKMSSVVKKIMARWQQSNGWMMLTGKGEMLIRSTSFTNDLSKTGLWDPFLPLYYGMTFKTSVVTGERR